MGHVVIHTTMGKRGAQVEAILSAMMEYEVPLAERPLAGELSIPGAVVQQLNRLFRCI